MESIRKLVAVTAVTASEAHRISTKLRLDLQGLYGFAAPGGRVVVSPLCVRLRQTPLQAHMHALKRERVTRRPTDHTESTRRNSAVQNSR